MNFNNKVILITGASSGIGADAARHLSKLGAKVAVVGRDVQRLNDVVEQIKSAGSSTPLAIVADVTTDAERIINETVLHFGRLDVLINSAGIYLKNSIENIDLVDYDNIMNTDVRSVIQLMKLAVPHLEKTKGNILNVSGTLGMRVLPDNLAYCIAKAALNQLTRSAALDLAPKGIRVNAINPVAIRTPQHIGISLQDDKYFEKFKNIYPVGRVGETSDTSYAIAFLINDCASFFTGTLLPVDGGVMLGSK